MSSIRMSLCFIGRISGRLSQIARQTGHQKLNRGTCFSLSLNSCRCLSSTGTFGVNSQKVLNKKNTKQRMGNEGVEMGHDTGGNGMQMLPPRKESLFQEKKEVQTHEKVPQSHPHNEQKTKAMELINLQIQAENNKHGKLIEHSEKHMALLDEFTENLKTDTLFQCGRWLQYLLMRTAGDSLLVQRLTQEIEGRLVTGTWKDVKQLLSALYVTIDHPVCHNILKASRRITEGNIKSIDNFKDLQLCISLQEQPFDSEVLLDLEVAFHRHMKEATTQDIVNFLMKMFEMGWKNIALTKSLIGILQPHFDMTLIQLLILLRNMKQFGVIDRNVHHQVCRKIAIALKTQPNKSFRLLTGVLYSLSRSSFRDQDLIKTVVAHINQYDVTSSNFFDEETPRQIHAAYLTLGILNFTDDSGEKMNRKLRRMFPMESCPPKHYLDIVWSLAILEQATADEVGKVLQKGVQYFLEDNREHSKGYQLGVEMKLLNLQGYIALDLGLDVPNIDTRDWLISDHVAEQNKVASLVCDVLQKANIPFQSNVNISYGHSVDAELYVDSSGSPVADPTAHKVVVKCTTRNNTVSTPTDYVLNGKLEMMGRHLRKMGYTVVWVPYYEWWGVNRNLECEYLLQKIKSAVSEKMKRKE